MLRVVEAVHRSDTGRQREANEDAWFARAPVFAVADGMGGAQAGEVASRIAVEAFEPERDDSLPPERYLSDTARLANRQIFELAQGDRSRSGMGTTLTAAMVDGDEVSFGHVGDSRAYRWRDGELTQITSDHSLVEELRRQGKLTSDQAAEHPQRSVITRALGPEPDVLVDTMTVQARPGDVFVLCSDGLTTMLSDQDVAAVLAASADLDGAARELIRAANERGGRDNITVVLFRTDDADAASVPAAAPPTEDATLVGPSAESEGFTADAVREGVEAQRAAAASRARDRPIAVPSGRGEYKSPWRGRITKSVVLLLVLGVVGFGAWYGARQVWFLGSDDSGRLALFRGLPYDLPFGIELYSEVYTVPVTVDAIPEERRDAATDHELRSRDDAVDLLEDLEQAAEDAAEPNLPRPPSGGGSKNGNQSNNGGGQNKNQNQGGSGSSGGGGQGG